MPQPSLKFKATPQAAGIGLDFWGSSLAELFENAAQGLFSLLINPAEVSMAMQERIRVESSDASGLLVAWLNELLFIYQVNRLVLCRFRITQITETSLEAEVGGELLDTVRHHPLREIRSATHHELSAFRSPEGYRGHVLFDA